jgi:hypothetical protein
MSVDAEWSKDHVSTIGPYTLFYWKLMLPWLIGDRAGPLGGKWRSSVGKVGEWYVESRYL